VTKCLNTKTTRTIASVFFEKHQTSSAFKKIYLIIHTGKYWLSSSTQTSNKKTIHIFV